MRWLACLFVVGALCVVADARPGGGQSYSGGSHSSGGSYSGGGGHSYSGGSYHSSGGSGGGGSLSPGAAIGLLIGALIMLAIIAAAQSKSSDSFYTSSYSPPIAPSPVDLRAVTTPDPDFSRVAFEDFVYRLYSAAHRARHDRAELAKLTPYLDAGASDMLARRASPIQQVVIGNLRIVDAGIEAETARVRLVVAIEANLAGPNGTVNASERWTFVRMPGIRTRPPDKTRTLNCPSCNAPFTAKDDPRTCAHCGTAINVGQFDWTVSSIVVDAETGVGPTLTGYVEEVGNDYPTLTEPQAHANLMLLRKDDPEVTWEAFEARVGMIYGRLNEAWNAQDLTPVRGLVTSSLLQYLQFWIDEYKRQRLVNHLDFAKVKHTALARVSRDKWYDAITVRVYAAGADYTTDAANRVVGGMRDAERAYTEYWTFLRSSARRGRITTTPSCPNCGAPLAISNAGACTHCNAEVESGSFDWTLSKIEQDDVYRG